MPTPTSYTANLTYFRGKTQRFFQRKKECDTTIKWFIANLGIGKCIAKGVGASKETTDGFRASIVFLRDVRFGLGLLNIFDVFCRAIPDMIVHLYDIKKLVLGLYNNEPKVELTKRKVEVVDVDGSVRAETVPDECNDKIEIVLMVVHRVSAFFSDFFYAICFVFIRPVQFAERFWGPLGDNAKNMGRSFTVLIVISDTAALIKGGANLGFNAKRFHTLYHTNPNYKRTAMYHHLKQDSIDKTFVCGIKIGDSTLGWSRVVNKPLGGTCTAVIAWVTATIAASHLIYLAKNNKKL